MTTPTSRRSASRSMAEPPSLTLTIADHVEQQLRDQIVHGERSPGSRLNESEIAQILGVSRGPVREAIQRLSHRGLVVVESRRGAFVRQLDLADVRQLFEVRIALECEAAELAASRMPTSGLAELLNLQKDADDELALNPGAEVFDTHDLHDLVVRHAGNPRLERMVSEVNVELRLVRSRSATCRDRATEAADEHHQLIACLTSGDREGARRAMRSHLTASLQNTMRLLHDSGKLKGQQ